MENLVHNHDGVDQLSLDTEKHLEYFHNIVKRELEIFQKKFSQLKEQVLNRSMYHDQGIKTDYEVPREETASTTETDSEDLEEYEDAKQKLEDEVRKNRELEKDVVDLNAMLDLYVREAQNRDRLDEEWREIMTEKLKNKVRSLEGEVFQKLEEIHNLTNSLFELRGDLSAKDEELIKKNEEIERLKGLLRRHEKTQCAYKNMRKVSFDLCGEEE